MNGYFSLLSPENLTFHTYNVAHIKFLKICIRLFSQTVTCHIALNISGKILYITERSFSHNTLGFHLLRYV